LLIDNVVIVEVINQVFQIQQQFTQHTNSYPKKRVNARCLPRWRLWMQFVSAAFCSSCNLVNTELNDTSHQTSVITTTKDCRST